jgi:hypothetical protein
MFEGTRMIRGLRGLGCPINLLFCPMWVECVDHGVSGYSLCECAPWSLRSILSPWFFLVSGVPYWTRKSPWIRENENYHVITVLCACWHYGCF